MKMKSWLKKLQIRWMFFRWDLSDRKTEREGRRHLVNTLAMLEKSIRVYEQRTKQWRGEMTVAVDSNQADMEAKRHAFLRSIEYCMHVHVEAFCHLTRRKHYESAHHYIRMLSDLCLRAYAATLFDSAGYDRYVLKFLQGGSYEDMRYKGEYLTAKKIQALMAEEYGFVGKAQKEGNTSTHFTNFYCPDFYASKSSHVKVSQALEMANIMVALLLNLMDILYKIQGKKLDLKGLREELEDAILS